MSTPSSVDLLNGIVRNGFCSGCGACAYASGGRMALNEYGEYQPDFAPMSATPPVASALSSVCPSLHPELNEDVLAGARFAGSCKYDPRLGYHGAIYAGYVREDDYRAKGTSGGIGTWIGVELLRRRLIDGVIHVKPIERRSSTDPFFAYAISRSAEHIRAGAQTRYHAVQISDVLAEVRAQPGRYLFIGLPCFCKAVRRLQLVDEVIAERVQFVGSLICGHLKSVHWTLALAWGAGIHPDRLETFQYRTKGPNISAQAYVFTAAPHGSADGGTVRRNASTVVGGKWNASAMMLSACDYCDDVVGETADISIGDAWLSKYESDPHGTNLVVVRHPELAAVLSEAAQDGRLELESITADEAARSQDGGIRSRREGLSYRLAKAKADGRDIPVKRVAPGSIELSARRKRIYDARTQFARASRLAFRSALDANDYAIFSVGMKRYEEEFRRFEIITTLPRRLLFSLFSEAFLRQALEVRRTLPSRIVRRIKVNWAAVCNLAKGGRHDTV